MHHGAKNSACRHTPPVKWATGKTSDNASIPASLTGSGAPVMFSGGWVIAARAPASLKIAPPADRVCRHPKRAGKNMDTLSQTSDSGQIADSRRYARCIQTSKRVRWDLDEDVIRGRHFDTAQKFLPDG